MTFQDKLQICIDKQIAFNAEKNIFYNKFDGYLALADSTRDFIEQNKDEIIEFFQTSSKEEIEEGLEVIVRKVVYNFSNTNQYINVEEEDLRALKKYYYSLMAKIVTELLGRGRREVFDDIIKTHYDKLKKWLKESNPFIEKINKDNKKAVSAVCGEYSAELQVQVLGLDLDDIVEPILDIGCGSEANLVYFFIQLGLEVYGLDRVIARKTDYLFEVNWLEFDYGEGKWGTIVSHLGFSNHFVHHHHRKDGKFEEYAHKYMEILNSLKVGGKFFYSPGIDFVEQYLDIETFSVETKQHLDGGVEMTSSVITKLK